MVRWRTLPLARYDSRSRCRVYVLPPRVMCEVSTYIVATILAYNQKFINIKFQYKPDLQWLHKRVRIPITLGKYSPFYKMGRKDVIHDLRGWRARRLGTGIGSVLTGLT